MTRRRTNAATREAIFAAHGGEMRFWLGWAYQEIAEDVCDWFRTEAQSDPALEEDVASLDRPTARREVTHALEATNYLAPASEAPGTAEEPQELTDLVLRKRRVSHLPVSPVGRALMAGGRSGEGAVPNRVGLVLFRLLDEVGLALTPRAEVAQASALLKHLVGRPAVAHFQELSEWLTEARARMDLAGRPAFYPAWDRLLLWLAPECFLTDGRRPLYALSFRLFLRSRLKQYCQQQGWLLKGKRAAEADTAFARLSRERIGALIREALSNLSPAEAADIEPAKPLQLLQTAP